jgi:hypothetical protein
MQLEPAHPNRLTAACVAPYLTKNTVFVYASAPTYVVAFHLASPKLASLGMCCGRALAASSHFVAGLVRFPHGVVDDVEGIAVLTSARGLGLHVDNCLGGFLLTHLQAIGAFTRAFDFQARLRC